MTDVADSYLRDLEEAAAAVGAIPGDYAMLRDLLASLPAGTPPDVREGRTGITAQAAGTGGLDATGLTIQSPTPIGSDSGISQGVVQAPTIGLRNLLEDPRLASIPFSSIAPGGAFVNFGREFRVKFDAGTTGATVTCFKNQDYDDNTVNPFQSTTMVARVANWTGAGTMVLTHQLDRQGSFFAAYDPEVLPFAVFSVDIFKDNTRNQLFTNVVSWVVQLVIRDDLDTVDLAVSTPIDYKALSDGGYVRHWVAVDSTNLLDGIRPQIRMTVVTSGSLGGGNTNPSYANPQLELSPYQQPTIFLEAPRDSLLTTWVEGGTDVVKIGDPGDNTQTGHGRVNMGLSTASEGRIGFGAGGSVDDIKLRRVAAKTLQEDDGAVSPGPMKHWLAGDLVQILANALSISYNGDGTVASVSRSGAQGTATSTVAYSGSHIASVTVVRGGKTVTVTPSYTGDLITGVTRSVA